MTCGQLVTWRGQRWTICGEVIAPRLSVIVSRPGHEGAERVPPELWRRATFDRQSQSWTIPDELA